jgi:SWI/SNF-related matrix-associated actin-dependent regulator of chromatin subfamily D
VPILIDDPLDVFTAYFRAATFTSSKSSSSQAFMKRLAQISLLDKDIALAVQGMYAGKAKVDFLHSLATEPVGFMRRWMSSQQVDETVILAEDRARGDEWRRGGRDGVWGSASAREGVGLVLGKKGPI